METMPEWKRSNIRSALTDPDKIHAVLIEINTASRCLAKRATLEWIPRQQGIRTADLLVKLSEFEFEIECKSKIVEAGRKVARKAFYQFCDSLNDILQPTPGMARTVLLSVPERFEANAEWQTRIREAMAGLSGSRSIEVSGVEIRQEVRPLSDSIDEQICLSRIKRSAEPFGHYVFARSRDGIVSIACKSRRNDQVVKSLEDDLRDALGQLSGSRPAELVCYIPEVASFEGLQTGGNALRVMTARFFEKLSARKVFRIYYVSDSPVTGDENTAEAGTHSLCFDNPRYLGNIPAEAP